MQTSHYRGVEILMCLIVCRTVCVNGCVFANSCSHVYFSVTGTLISPVPIYCNWPTCKLFAA